MSKTIEITLPELPHGHGLSFKRGIVDALLRSSDQKAKTHKTKRASYRLGYDLGAQIKAEIAKQVR